MSEIYKLGNYEHLIIYVDENMENGKVYLGSKTKDTNLEPKLYMPYVAIPETDNINNNDIEDDLQEPEYEDYNFPKYEDYNFVVGKSNDITVYIDFLEKFKNKFN